MSSKETNHLDQKGDAQEGGSLELHLAERKRILRKLDW